MVRGYKMNRQILFRGKRKDNGKWVYGFYALFASNKGLKHGIYTGAENGCVIPYEVNPETVGQFTGMYDKFNNKIFEGDIVKCLSLEYGYVNKEVYYTEGKAKFGLSSCGTDYEFGEYIDVEVIGNIYDSPELLEK